MFVYIFISIESLYMQYSSPGEKHVPPAKQLFLSLVNCSNRLAFQESAPPPEVAGFDDDGIFTSKKKNIPNQTSIINPKKQSFNKFFFVGGGVFLLDVFFSPRFCWSKFWELGCDDKAGGDLLHVWHWNCKLTWSQDVYPFSKSMQWSSSKPCLLGWLSCLVFSRDRVVYTWTMTKTIFLAHRGWGCICWVYSYIARGLW